MSKFNQNQKKYLESKLTTLLTFDENPNQYLNKEGLEILEKYRIKHDGWNYFVQRRILFFFYIRVSQNFKTKIEAREHLVRTAGLIDYILDDLIMSWITDKIL